MGVAQKQSLLKPDVQSIVPQWEESLHYAINKVKDTIYLSVGAKVNEVLLQEDHFNSEGYWEGVDRFVWEGEEQVRVYHYDGKEELIRLNEYGAVSNTILDANGLKEEINYQWDKERIVRMAHQSNQGLEEQVYVYHPDNSRLVKVKYFYNGVEEQQLRLSYAKNGFLQKEELWVKGELSIIATHSYKEALLTSSSVINLSEESHQLQEIHNYRHLDNGQTEQEISHFSGSLAALNARTLCTFDDQGRLLKLSIEYLEDPELHKEVFLYQYPERETAVLEALNLKTGQH